MKCCKNCIFSVKSEQEKYLLCVRSEKRKYVVKTYLCKRYMEKE